VRRVQTLGAVSAECLPSTMPVTESAIQQARSHAQWLASVYDNDARRSLGEDSGVGASSDATNCGLPTGLVTLSKNRLFSIVTRQGQVIGIAQSGALSEGSISQ
jgi:hypothetical protein